MPKIRVALVGIGNCASSLLQGLRYYGEDDSRIGLWHRQLGGYSVSDMEVVAAFDVDSKKIGLDLADAAFTIPNVAQKHFELKPFGVKVQKGLLEDNFPSKLKSVIHAESAMADEVISTLKNERVDVMVNLISSGLDHSSKAYAKAAVDARSSFVNATPSTVASDSRFQASFRVSRLVLAGDDLMSQFGGTAFHRGILDFIHSRGMRVVRSYQLDVGGGTETLNTLDEDIRALKRSMKTSSIVVEIPYEIDTVAGTTDYVDYMGNNRTSYFWIEGGGFLGSEARIDVYLRTSDGPNAGNVLFDVIRAIKFSEEKGEYGVIQEICNYGFKKSANPVKLHQAYESFGSKYLLNTN